MRDRESAEVAIEAALTGHLVLSSLHTNDAPRAITRLLDMGIEWKQHEECEHLYEGRDLPVTTDFRAVFSKMAANDFDGWAVVEWECCLKHPEDGAREGAQFVRDHIIRVTEKAFDDFADGGVDESTNKTLLGLD